MRIRARHYRTSQKTDIVCRDGRISSANDPTSDKPDLEASWVAPAFFDLQINGCDGHNFGSLELNIDQVCHIVGVCRRHGISSLCPTLVTNSAEALTHGFHILAKACASGDLGRALPVFHLEGPYISPEDGPRGAHPREHVRPPSWDEFQRFQDAADGRIGLVTLAPEHENSLAFIERLVDDGIVVAIGHTAATASQIRDAVKAGARLCTHLGNGAHAVLPRHDNYIWAQLAEDQLWASIICDGHHLPEAVVKCMVRVKSPERLILTCDASTLAGMPPGTYREWNQELEVSPQGKIMVAGTPYLAGAWAFTDHCVSNVLCFTDMKLHDAIDLAGAQPRKLLGQPVVDLEPGSPADLILFDWEPGGEMKVTHTLAMGEVLT